MDAPSFLNFAFVETTNIPALEAAIVMTNRTRQHTITYGRILLAAPRKGWTAVIIDSAAPDHYLLRNLSGRLSTRTFELGLAGVALYYRVHEHGRTVGAFESHLALWVTQQLRVLMNSGDTMRLDLAEPAARLVLQRYHEFQRSRTWVQPSAREPLPPALEHHYSGKAAHLKGLVREGVDLAYVQQLISPGFAAEVALERLMNVLALPYLMDDHLPYENETEDKELLSDPPLPGHEASSPPESKPRSLIEGYVMLQPTSWPENAPLPKGWVALKRESWQRELL